MILGEPRAQHVTSGGRATLDDIFRRNVARRPDAVALVDPLNRESFTEGTTRRITYAEADRMVSAIAGRLRRLGLLTDAVVGLQLPNTVESVLTILGVLRAGMIAVPLPLLWRRAECTAALGRLGAKGLITVSRIGAVDHCELAMHVAAEVFPIRYVCGFGTKPVDGIIPLDDCLTAPTIEVIEPFHREANPAAHVAVVTWDMTPDGHIAVGRSHNELIAGGLAAMLEGRLEPDAIMLTTCTMSSFSGLALSIMPWLLTGGTLVLHHPFDATTFAEQCRDEHCDTVVLPGPLVPRLADAGLLAQPELMNVIALWRAPERLEQASPWRHDHAELIDVLAFGETALFGMRRAADGMPAPIPTDQVMAPRGAPGAVLVAELMRTEAGTLALRGPMVPRYAFPPGAERSPVPHFFTDHNGLVDTGYPCRIDPDTDALRLTGPSGDLVSVGGYRFNLSELQDLVRRIGDNIALTALPDALSGHRLAGHAGDLSLTQETLIALGINPLVASAFRERGQPGTAVAAA